MLQLQFPNTTHKKAYEKLIKDWWEAEKIPTPPSRLFAWKDFEEFLSIVENDISNNLNWVNSHLFFLVDWDEILWSIQVRHTINHPNLIEKWWHIWYWVSPKHRQKWYATIMLELALKEAKKIWLEKVLITCDINNIGSNKVIQKNWWIFERIATDGEINRYWIDLKTYDEFENFWNKKWKNTWLIEENEFAKKVLKYFPNWENKKILDLWAWNWRDSLFFAKNWFEAEAFDFSENALNNLKNFAENEKLNIKTTIWNTKDFEFTENNYDIIYACNSLHYFNLETTKEIFKNLKKSLKNWWYFFLRVKSVDDIDFWKWEKLEENFYKNWEDIKYYFTKELIEEIFSDFEILELFEISDKHNKISWEVTINWFIDLVAKK